ncbi:MAG: hypothetical protein CM15mP59_1460 [Flavobacteriaceae bacterium]|nr:MAG: hypothetical protein CM15mP59_1460 [Flavobacteriaceae bacterium]
MESAKRRSTLIIGSQKGLVEETDLRIPNMRGIMQARQKPLEVVPAAESQVKSAIQNFEKPAPKAAVKLIPADDIDQLIDLYKTKLKSYNLCQFYYLPNHKRKLKKGQLNFHPMALPLPNNKIPHSQLLLLTVKMLINLPIMVRQN